MHPAVIVIILLITATTDRMLRWSIASGFSGGDFVIVGAHLQRSYLGLPEAFTPYLTILSIVGMLAVAGIAARLLCRKRPRQAFAALSVLLGGANNVADRLLYDGVWDYWTLAHPFGMLWWNLGDMMVVGGAFFLLWRSLALSSR